jgi:PPK2 family polyphosphate:nucleotide phosphotransferase
VGFLLYADRKTGRGKLEAMKDAKHLLEKLIAPPGRRLSLASRDTGWTGRIKNKTQAADWLREGVKRLSDQQEKLYAQDTYALLVIFQAMDAAGKDGTIRHVMSGVNPQGCQVFSFKVPSAEERDHDYLWRSVKALPERGRIGIHNRSYYEEVLVARVHPEILAAQQLPPRATEHGIWRRRFDEINAFEKYLVDNGTIVLKFFLHVSRAEQKKRFLDRLDRPEKNWKFSYGDVKERAFWNDYMRAYEDAFTHTSTRHAPWYIVPADHKWFMRLAVASVIVHTLERLDLRFPEVSTAKRADLDRARDLLRAEVE